MLGLYLYDVPEEFGGLGLGMMAKIIVWSEVSRTTALPSRALELFGPAVSPILYTLEGEAREKYLLPVIRGEKVSCFAQTEPDAGSDPANMRTNAVRDGDHYVINGVKRFITNADNADFAQVFAVTDPQKKARGGISGFLVDMDTPGVKVASHPTTSWSTTSRARSCSTMCACRSPTASARRAKASATRSRGSIPAASAMARAASASWSAASSSPSPIRRQRKTFGAALAERQGVQWPIIDMHMDAHKLRLMLYHAAWKFDRGEDCRQEAFMVKIFGDERSFWAADRCMQIHGGMGLSKELPIERFFRDQRSMMITEGSIEVLRMALARMVIGIK